MRRKFWKRGKRGLTWMAAGALFLTLWSRLRDDRLADKMGAGGLTEVHDLPAFFFWLESSSEADGLGGRRTGQDRTVRAQRSLENANPSALIPAQLRRYRTTGAQYSILRTYFPFWPEGLMLLCLVWLSSGI
jgi:hypothetical protein